MSYNLKITVFNNVDNEQEFILQDESGAAYDLTDCKLIFGYGTEEKTIASHTTGLASNKCLQITNVTAGTFKLLLPATLLKSIGTGTLLHDLVLVCADTSRTSVWSGQMVIKRGLA